MWFLILKWLFLNVLLPAIAGGAGTLFALRSFDTGEVETFAASSGGGNFLLWVVVIALVIHALMTAKIPQVESLKAKLLAWIAARLAAMASKIKPEGT